MVTNEREQAHSDDCERCYWRGRAEAAEAKVARFEAVFSGGPDTPCRTVWQDGVECVSVPMDDLRAALDGAE